MTTVVDAQQALYRFYDVGGQLLYVGITNDPGRRFAEHSTDKTWWAEVAGISVEWHSTRDEAYAAETRAIGVERPRHNIRQRNDLVKVRAPGAAPSIVWTCDECHLPIGRRSGYIWINASEVEKSVRAIKANEARTTDRFQLLTDDELDREAHWKAHHEACDEQSTWGDDSYWIDVDRISSQARVLGWTLHLMEKSWFTYTDWPSFVRQHVLVDA